MEKLCQTYRKKIVTKISILTSVQIIEANNIKKMSSRIQRQAVYQEQETTSKTEQFKDNAYREEIRQRQVDYEDESDDENRPGMRSLKRILWVYKEHEKKRKRLPIIPQVQSVYTNSERTGSERSEVNVKEMSQKLHNVSEQIYDVELRCTQGFKSLNEKTDKLLQEQKRQGEQQKKQTIILKEMAESMKKVASGMQLLTDYIMGKK